MPPARLHYWTLMLRSGEVLKGVDDFPTPLDKLNAKCLILDTRDTSVELQVPEGHELIFKRRVQIAMTEGMEEIGRAHRYIVGTRPMGQSSEARAVDHAPP